MAPPPAGDAKPWRGPGSRYLGAAAACAVAAALAWTLHGVLDAASLVLLFLLAVVLTAARFGQGPATLAAALAVLLFNLMFVPPRFSLAVADQQMLFTFAVMLAVGLLVGRLTAGLRTEADRARARERQMRSLYELARELGGALTAVQVSEALARFAQSELAARSRLWVQSGGRRVEVPPVVPAPAAAEGDGAAAPVAPRQDGAAAPDDTEVFSADGRACRLPLLATMAVRGVLELQRPQAASPWRDEERRLLRTCASLLGGALERIHYLEVAQASAVEIEGERLRSTLLAAVSHDLRTPLAALVGLTESLALAQPAADGPRREIAAAVVASARRMAALADNLLDMARLQAGRVQLNRQWQPLEEVVAPAVAAVPGLAGRPLTLDLPPDLPLVHVDAVLMERLLVNLLENAVKYTPAGSAIELRARAEAGQLHLSVRDHGPGVPPGQALFRLFERGEREGATPGFGLGLALCRCIAQAHGGTLQVEPVPGGGACFVTRLPLGDAPAVPADEPTDEPRP